MSEDEAKGLKTYRFEALFEYVTCMEIQAKNKKEAMQKIKDWMETFGSLDWDWEQDWHVGAFLSWDEDVKKVIYCQGIRDRKFKSKCSFESTDRDSFIRYKGKMLCKGCYEREKEREKDS